MSDFRNYLEESSRVRSTRSYIPIVSQHYFDKMPHRVDGGREFIIFDQGEVEVIVAKPLRCDYELKALG